MKKQLLALTAAGAAIVLGQEPALAQYEHGWMWQSGWGGFMGGGGLGMIVFWGAIILLIVLAVRGFGPRREATPPPPPPPLGEKTPLQILQERYARGDIDTTDYEERKKALGG